MIWKEIKQAHFIGIGGIGLSAIARMFLFEGKTVTGSDRRASPITEELEKLGAQIKIGESAANLPPETELVIHTIAITPDNPELLEAQKRGLKILTYPQALGQLSAAKQTIAVSGTHGKTTTTAMLGQIFIAAGLEPTVIVGSLTHVKLPNGNHVASNFIGGKGQHLIVEACEYRRSFLNLSPRLAIITNIDNDHLDYYKDLTDIQSAFAEFAGKLPADGVLVCDPHDERLKPVLCNIQCRTVDYTQEQISVPLQVPGVHNIKNAQAALAAARAAGISSEIALKSLAQFTGTWRRFQFKGKTKQGALVYDDYAHHPSEIKATLAGARAAFPDHQIIAVFQPHLYSRTKLLLSDFALSFSDADQVLLLPIYAAREPLDPSISAEILATAIKQNGTPVQSLPDFTSIQNFLSTLQTSPSTLILIMGAGNIFELAESLTQF